MLALAIALLVHADPHPSGVRLPSVRAALLEAKAEDQAVRDESKRTDSEATRARFRASSKRSVELMRKIVAEHGWPGRSLVGPDGAMAAWVLAQHLDEEPALQRQCLGLLERAVADGEADAESLAYLTDRVLVNEGKPQRYGTQGNGAAGDVSRVNANRKVVGLPPLPTREAPP